MEPKDLLLCLQKLTEPKDSLLFPQKLMEPKDSLVCPQKLTEPKDSLLCPKSLPPITIQSTMNPDSTLTLYLLKIHFNPNIQILCAFFTCPVHAISSFLTWGF
jgi:hypothetical protein